MNRNWMLSVASVVLAGCLSGRCLALSVSAVGADVSVWDSTVATNPLTGIYPVGGSGQVNGEFVTDTYIGSPAGAVNGLQIGLRAQERFGGPTLTRIGNTYYALPGTTGTSVLGATWNYDIHLDFGTSFLATQQGTALTPDDMRLFSVIFEMDIDPTANVSFVATDLNAVATAAGVPATAPILLLQASQNMLFNVFGGGPGVFDPNTSGTYDFRLTVSDPFDPTDIEAQVDMRVVVVPLPAGAWMGVALMSGLGLTRLVRRRLN